MARIGLSVVLVSAVVLVGCGGGEGLGPPAEEAKSERVIAEPPSWDQLLSDLARVGKPLPEFLSRGERGRIVAPAAAAEAAVEPRAYMSVLRAPPPIPSWTSGSVSSSRVQWYECPLWALDYPTDVALRWGSGDPDLFVFTPMWWGDAPDDSLVLIGYSINGTGMNENVGSFYPGDWGGSGRYVAAVYGFWPRSSSFKIRFW